MSTGLAHDFKEQVRAQTDIVALIGESITLQPARGGREYKCLCPFHDDHNPSMTVSPERQSYKCWVCNEGGDCFSWVMKHDGLAFPEALKLLADRAGLEMPARYAARNNGASRDSRQQLFDVLAWAETQFHNFLMTSPGGEPGRRYLESRGFAEQTLRQYRLGFHPQNWEWLLDRAQGKYTAQQLAAAGLAVERDDGSGYFDRFVGRVLFPIRDERGRVVAFGGRILPHNDGPRVSKYLNSSDSAVFSKSRTLYGLDLARDAIRRRDEAVVVEGYTDCIMAVQCGVDNAVAILGTALTELHVQLLKRFARKIVLVLDGDAAGKMASERSLGKFLAQEVDLRVLTLPPKQDPADFLSRRGVDEFRDLAANALEAWEYKLQSAIETHTLESIDARQRVLEEMLAVLAGAPQMAGTVREDLILSRVARILEVPERKIRQQLLQQRRGAASNRTTPHGPAAESDSAVLHSADDFLECELLEIVFAQPEAIAEISGRISAEEIRHAALRQIYQLCCDLWEQGLPPGYERVMSVLEDADLKRLATEIDGFSREKQTAEKLRPDPAAGGVPAPSGLFEQVLSRLAFRRREESERRRSAEDGAPAGLTFEAKQKLRAMTELRQSDPHHKLKPQPRRKR